jgi:hypothetical protein
MLGPMVLVGLLNAPAYAQNQTVALDEFVSMNCRLTPNQECGGKDSSGSQVSVLNIDPNQVLVITAFGLSKSSRWYIMVHHDVHVRMSLSSD